MLADWRSSFNAFEIDLADATGAGVMTAASTQDHVVIVGAGQAGSELATALRMQGYAGAITLLGDEAYVPYRRPPLSKTFLGGESSLESLYIKPAETYGKHAIDCRVSVGVESIDRQAHQVKLFDGTALTYTTLVLATGGRARRLSLPGANRSNVHYVRTIDDILTLKAQFAAGRRLTIIGGGYIGLEAASVGIKHGLAVTVVESLPRVLARVAAPELSVFYERVHREHGVDLRLGSGVHALEGAERVETVVLNDGSRIDVDLVVAGIGIVPNTELAEAAGLEISNGIAVDAFARSSDPDIYAIGDCSFHVNEFYGRSMRLESVPNAMEQARTAAAAICGKGKPHAAVPWFWSDQYDLKLQMVGLSQGYDTLLVRGDMGTSSFSVFYLKDGVVISSDAINRPQDFGIAKRLVAERLAVDSARLCDDTISLKSLLTS